jgi:mannose-6-phosphate isomerase-like protein (cupin superfamily)
MPNYSIAQLNDMQAVECPCGYARRAFTTDSDRLASVHLVDISEDARPHFHKKMTEIYIILEGAGFVELDGDKIPVTPMTVIKIKPGCVHRAIGKMRLLNIAIPAFDAEDEWEL